MSPILPLLTIITPSPPFLPVSPFLLTILRRRQQLKRSFWGSQHFHALAQFVHAERDQLVQAYLHQFQFFLARNVAFHRLAVLPPRQSTELCHFESQILFSRCMFRQGVSPSFCFELAQSPCKSVVVGEVKWFEQVSLAELLLVEVALKLTGAIALLDFLHKAHVVLAEIFDDGVETALSLAHGCFLVCRGESGEGSAVLSWHQAWKEARKRWNLNNFEGKEIVIIVWHFRKINRK